MLRARDYEDSSQIVRISKVFSEILSVIINKTSFNIEDRENSWASLNRLYTHLQLTSMDFRVHVARIGFEKNNKETH